MEKKSIIIPAAFQGKRGDVTLASLLPSFSRSQITSWLKQGQITINNQVVKPKDKVFGGETVLITIDKQALESNTENYQPEDIPLNIIYQDEQVLIINKPAGLVVHPGAGNLQHTLVNGLIHHFPELKQLPRAGIIHRLDKDTTGLIIIAKQLASYTQLVRQMQERLIQRSYISLVQGHVIAGGEINTGYSRHPRNRLKMAVSAQGKQAITFYSVQKQYQFLTLLDVQLKTGRTHQIRVHMAHINHPIVGDPLYGKPLRKPPIDNHPLLHTVQQFKRQALHACRLTFNHPITDEELTCTAPLPDDFNQLLIMLDQHV